MSSVDVVLRLSYKGNLKAVQVNQNIAYQDVREMSIDKFNISKSRSEKLELRDSSGNLYSNENFSKFMETFPFDKRILYVTTTSSQPKAGTSEDVKITRTLSQRNEPEVKRLKKCRKFEKKRSTPVKRQNCFIGTLPASFVLGLQSPAHQTDKKSRKFKGIRA